MEVVLEEGPFIEGYGKGIVIWRISMVLDDIMKYEPTCQLLVNLKMQISNQPSVIEVTQLLDYSDIVIGTPNLLPLKGELILTGSREETRLLQCDSNLYYVERV